MWALRLITVYFFIQFSQRLKDKIHYIMFQFRKFDIFWANYWRNYYLKDSLIGLASAKFCLIIYSKYVGWCVFFIYCAYMYFICFLFVFFILFYVFSFPNIFWWGHQISVRRTVGVTAVRLRHLLICHPSSVDVLLLCFWMSLLMFKSVAPQSICDFI